MPVGECEYMLAIEDEDVNVIVEYSYQFGSMRFSYDEPDDYGYIEIDKITYACNGKLIDFDLTDKEIEGIENYISEKIQCDRENDVPDIDDLYI